MRNKISILAILFFVMLFACKRDWEQHYSNSPLTSKTNVWAAMQQDQDLVKFVQFIKDYQYDTLFAAHNIYTLFAPTNAAFTEFLATDTFGRTLLNYHIITSFVQSGSIQGYRKVQTLSKKFALFFNQGGALKIDDIAIAFESPLYENGKYFKIGKVDRPRPNLYEYYAVTNPILKKYIDSKDSVILDKNLSKAIGFDSKGNTIYDTVSYVYNSFESEFFPVKSEFRDQTATIVFPKEEDYNAALTLVAQSFNLPTYHDYQDIPLSWQYKILVPYLLEHGVFPNLVEEIEFEKISARDTVKLKNMRGDSIYIDYLPKDKFLCSNGYAYNYSSFRVPDTLFAATTKMEAELLLKNTGFNTYDYKTNVEVSSSTIFSPFKEYIAAASNDTIIKINFPKGYKGTFTIKFNVENLFPRKYLMIVRTNTNVGGIYKVYVNDFLVKTFDYYSYLLNSNSYTSVTGKKFKTVGGFNIFDCYVNNLVDFGKCELTFEYTAPGSVSNNGFSLDYVGFVPY